MQKFVITGALLGGFFGIWFTVSRWKNQTKESCQGRAWSYVIGAGVAFVIFWIVLIILSPGTVLRFPWLQNVQEFLVDVPVFTNIVVGISAFFVIYWVVGALVLTSKNLWKP